MKTADLITALAADNASKMRPVSQTMAFALAGSVAAAVAAFAMTASIRPDFTSALASYRFLLKFLSMGMLAFASALAVKRLARPDASAGSLYAVLALVPILLLAGAALELAVVPESERWARFVGTGFAKCVGHITLIGFIPLVLILCGLRQGAPANPTLAGAMAGFAAAGIAALFYAGHCQNDSPLFVASWYSLAAIVLAAAGAFAGARLLRW